MYNSLTSVRDFRLLLTEFNSVRVTSLSDIVNCLTIRKWFKTTYNAMIRQRRQLQGIIIS